MKPNIIIVMSDQNRADLRKGRGFSLDTMPFLDSYAKEGVDFFKAFTPNPICVAARVSMLTGRYPSAHQVRTNHNRQDVCFTKDLLDIVKEAGYVTALCGKNHSHIKDEEFDFHHTTQEIELNEELKTYLKQIRTGAGEMAAPGGVKEQLCYKNVSDALSFIDGTDRKKPFFTWVSMEEPHVPYQVPEPYFNMFPPEQLPVMASDASACKQKGFKYEFLDRAYDDVMGEDRIAQLLRSRSNYYGMLRMVDDQFKRLVTGLRERNLEDNTIVIFLADHGDYVGEYGLMRKGADLSNVLTNIPMVWHGPGIVSYGPEKRHFVNLVDVLPTICDILNVEIPFGCQGKSICSLLKQKEIPDREFDVAYSESGYGGLYWDFEDALTMKEEGARKNEFSFDSLNTWTQCGQVRMLCKENYKIQMDMMGNGYLYDLKNDPYEVHNLWNNVDYQEKKSEMLSELMSATLRACDPLPTPRNRYRVKVHPKGYYFQTYHVSSDQGVRKDHIIRGEKGSL